MFSGKNRILGLSFSLKLSLLYAFFFAVSSITLFGIAYYLVNQLVAEKEESVIQARLQEYRAWYEEGGVPAIRERFDQQAGIEDDAFFTRIIGPLNQVLFVDIPPGNGVLDIRQFETTERINDNAWFSVRRYGKNYWTVGSERLPGGLILQVGKNSTQSRHFLIYFRSVCIKVVLPVILAGILLGGLVTFRAMRPLRSLIVTVGNIISTGEMSTRVPVRSEKGELNELVSLFNRMLDKNESLIRAMHESLDNVAHDLRTPMTRLRGIAELAMQESGNPEACYEALADCMEESERVVVMLTTLMDVAEAETGAMRLDIEDVSVPQVLLSVMDLYEVVAEEKRVAVTADLPDELCISADRMRIRQVFGNLLDNALKYSLPGGRIEITAFGNGDFAVITMTDEGLGISPEDIDRIWDRLYRGDRSRTKRGLGLGLSLVQAVVQAHGGSVHVESALNSGSTFTVALPLNSADV